MVQLDTCHDTLDTCYEYDSVNSEPWCNLTHVMSEMSVNHGETWTHAMTLQTVNHGATWQWHTEMSVNHGKTWHMLWLQCKQWTMVQLDTCYDAMPIWQHFMSATVTWVSYGETWHMLWHQQTVKIIKLLWIGFLMMICWSWQKICTAIICLWMQDDAWCEHRGSLSANKSQYMQTQIKEIRWKSQYNLIRVKTQGSNDRDAAGQSFNQLHMNTCLKIKKVFSGQATDWDCLTLQ